MRPSLGEEMAEKAYISLSVGHIQLPIRNPLDLIMAVLKAAEKLLTTRVEKPIAVYAYNQDPENVVAGLVFKFLLRSPLVIVYHHVSDSTFSSFGEGILGRRRKGYGLLASAWRSAVPALNRISAKVADVHLALSYTTKVEVEQLLNVKDCVVVGNGIDTTKFKPLEIEKKYDAAFLGRIVHQKGIETLLRAWAIVCRQKPDSKLILMGGVEKPELVYFSKLARELGVLGSVEFKGFLNDDEVVKSLCASRLFVFPSRKEGFAQAVSQAMACGLCCVISDIPPLRETYGDVAIFVPPDDPGQLAACISKMLDDPEKCRELGIRSRQFVQKFNWGGVVEKELEAMHRRTGLQKGSDFY